MSMVALVSALTLVCVAVAVRGGRRRPEVELETWAVSGRRMRVWSLWVLQAGETFTAFTFMGTIGVVVAYGGGGFYVIPYLPLAYLGLYFLAPRIWARARSSGCLSQADFVRAVYDSAALARVVAVVGIVILLPYLQLQFTAMSLLIETAMGLSNAPKMSATVAFVVVIGLVLWAGLSGISRLSYLKDGLMLLVITGLMITLPLMSDQGHFGAIEEAVRRYPEAAYAAPGPHGPLWAALAMAVSAVGVMFCGLPHMWPAILAAGSAKSLRQSVTVLPIYNLIASIPMVLAYLYISRHGMDVEHADAALIVMVRETLPGWALVLMVVAGLLAAMTPAAAMLLALAPVAADHVFRARDARAKLVVSRYCVLGIGLGSLTFAWWAPNLLGNMLLITFEGSLQLIPAVAGSLLRHTPSPRAIMVGLIAGTLFTLGMHLPPGEPAMNAGVLGLVINLVAAVTVAVFYRWRSGLGRS